VVAELLRLRLRLLVNTFRRSPAGVFAVLFGLGVAVAGVVAAWGAAEVLAIHQDAYVRRMMIAVGSLLTVSAFLIPLVFSRRASLHPRAFQGYGIRTNGIVAILLVFALTGPLLLMLAIAYASVRAWPDAGSRDVAAVAAPILFLIAFFSVLIGRELGVTLRRHPHTGAAIAVLSVVVLMVGAVMVVVLAAQRIPELIWLVRLTGPLAFVHDYAGFLGGTPIGMLWSAPWLASTTGRQPDDVWSTIWAGAAIAVVLFATWTALMAWQLRPTRRLRVTRRWLSTGWFGRLPSTPTGAVAARSFSYWLRDPRYRTVFAVLPILPLAILGAFAVAGVPFQYGVLVPLPIMVLVLAWSTMHNDVSYDSTAVWTHLAARTRGAQDRVGRMIPVLVFGVILLGIGVPLTAWGYGDPEIVPALLGVCLALLLGGLGVSSVSSALFPYPAPRPGDSASQQPQIAGGAGGVAQGFSVLAILLVATPALVSSGIWFAEGGAWNWIALLIGAVSGVLILVLGVRGGALSFDRRAPELLAFAVRH
jgi:ABC-2 type transport system permease protein